MSRYNKRTEFQIGDKIRRFECNDDFLTKDKIFTVTGIGFSEMGHRALSLKEAKNPGILGYYPEFFEIVENE